MSRMLWARRRGGVTLVELMIAMVILVVAALGVMGVFVWIARSIQHSKSRGLASNLTQEQVQILKQKNYYRVLVTTNPAYRTDFDPQIPYDVGYFPPETILEGGITFSRLTYVQWAMEVGGVVQPLPPTSSETNLKMITVTTIWTVDGAPSKVQITNVLSNPDAVVPSSLLTGIVSSGGVPLANAIVTVTENTGATGATNGVGRYNISLFPGNYNLSCDAQGYFTNTASVSISSGASVTQNFSLTAMTSATVSGYVWNNDHLVISQVMGSDISGTGWDQEFVEIYNPTTWTWTVAGAIGLKFQRMASQDAAPVPIAIDYSGSPATVAPGGYYLFVNTTTFTFGASFVTADARWDGTIGGANEANFAPRFVTAVGFENYNVITVNEDAIGSAAGGLILYEIATGRTLDAVGWTGNGGLSPAPPVFETTPIAQNIGLQRDEVYRRYSSTSGVSNTSGPGYDSNKNSIEWWTGGLGAVPRNNAVVHVTGGGTPALGASVSCNDGLSTAVQTVSTGNPPMAKFSIPSVATGTWTVFIASGSTAVEITNVTVSAPGTVWTPDAATSPPWVAAGRYEVFLSTTADEGYVSGSVKNASNNAIAPGIVVSNGSRTTTASTSTGFYMLKTQPGTFTVWANPNNAQNYVSESVPAITVNAGQVTSNVNFILSQAGFIAGFVSRDGVNPLPGVAVTATNSGGFVESQTVSGPDGKYRMVNVTTGTYTIEPVLGSGETSTPVSVTAVVSVGVQTNISTFTVQGAMGGVRGTVTRSGSAIRTGAMIVVTTTTIAGVPPTLNQAALTGVPYYVTASNEDGTYSLDVRGSTSTSYRVYGYYTEPAGAGWNMFSANTAGVWVTPGITTTTVNFAW